MNPRRPRRCPGCHMPYKLAPWQLDDGPCADGRYHCVACIIENRCGCTESANKHSFCTCGHASRMDRPQESVCEPRG